MKFVSIWQPPWGEGGVRGKAAPGFALTPALSRQREREKTLPTDYLTDVLGVTNRVASLTQYSPTEKDVLFF
jgi:hypothetical protein